MERQALEGYRGSSCRQYRRYIDVALGTHPKDGIRVPALPNVAGGVGLAWDWDLEGRVSRKNWPDAYARPALE